MGVDEWDLQVKYSYRCRLDVILENGPITNVIRNLLVYSTKQDSAVPL